MVILSQKNDHSWPRLVMRRQEQALSRPSECSILQKHDQFWPGMVMHRWWHDQFRPRLVILRREHTDLINENIMLRSQHNLFWPRLVILQLEIALCRPSECFHRWRHDHSWPKLVILRLRHNQSWPRKVMPSQDVGLLHSKRPFRDKIWWLIKRYPVKLSILSNKNGCKLPKTGERALFGWKKHQILAIPKKTRYICTTLGDKRHI